MVGENYVWCLVIIFILFTELGEAKRWEVGGRFYSHHILRESHKGEGNSYGGI